MRSLLAAICLALPLPPIAAGELREEIDSAKEAFHHALHDAPAIYLVCYYKVEMKLWNGDWEQLDIQATIVEVVRGDQKVGDRINFERVMDGKYGDISKLAGSLYYVQLYRNDHEGTPNFGKLDIDPQDPLAVFPYSQERSAMAAEHKKKAQQAGAGQPATLPESKSEGSDKPQPESEGRSR
ncbi:MAG: hypothetical protein J0M04_22095 [Verrucomicrobia bacterium]|nr:hypothetical protein [Verrucomicrobiota bacterium]